MPAPFDAARQHLYDSDLSGLRVLIIDRHPPARDALRLMLANLGITKVMGVGSSQDVLRQVKSNTYDLILSDYVLEDGRDGQQLLEELRLAKLVPLSTVFIVVTSERSYHNVVGVAELTPDDYLVKPFTPDQLQLRLGRALRRKSELGHILRAMEVGHYSQAVAACDELIGASTDFVLDALRLKGDLLNQLLRTDEAIALYREILTMRPLPWANMGLAQALQAKGDLIEAESLVRLVITDHKHFLVAHDFLARLLEAQGKLVEAQEALMQAAEISPHNTLRQRVVGDIAVRTGDLDTAEFAYQTALRRARGSSIGSVSDYANLSRVFIDQGKSAQAHAIAQELRRERRLDVCTEFTAHTLDSLAFHAEKNESAAKASLTKAMVAHEAVGGHIPDQLVVDLAHAALATGDKERAEALVRKVISENPDDSHLQEKIEAAYVKSGDAEAGRALLEAVSKEIVRINNQGVLTARSGDLEASVRLLSQAADRMPNVQFLVNAANAIFTLLDQRGWQQELGERGLFYLLKAQLKNSRHPKIISAYEYFQGVAQKYGVSVMALRQQVSDAMKSGTMN